MRLMTDKPRTYAFDFDGVIARNDGFKGHEHANEPIPETVEAIRNLKAKGHKILIYSTRSSDFLRNYCDNHDIPIDYYNENPDTPAPNMGKPVAYVYIDDRAIRYTGQSAQELVNEIENFRAYWK